MAKRFHLGPPFQEFAAALNAVADGLRTLEAVWVAIPATSRSIASFSIRVRIGSDEWFIDSNDPQGNQDDG